MSNLISREDGFYSALIKHNSDEGKKTLFLQSKVKDCVMSIGRVMADQVCACASLELERRKLQDISSKLSVLGPHHTDAATQTDATEDEEWLQLMEMRERLLEETRGAPKNCASMVDILKKRNAALLIREERELQRVRKLREEKQDRLNRLSQQSRSHINT